VKFDSRRIHIAGEQFFCRRGEVSYQRKEKPKREKNTILFDKASTFSVHFKLVSN
jgi:stalled ribosome alternative rescue factor ArfA